MDRPKNITEIIEKQRLGYNVTKQVDIAYNKLKCLSGDLNFFHDTQEERVYCPVFASKFCHNKGQEHLLITANEDGKIVLLDVNQQPGKKILSSFQAHDNAIFDLAWTNDDMNFISASGDHSATLWQIAEGDVKPICQYHGHLHSVKAISCRPDDHAVFATGGRDGALLIWDRRMSPCALVLNPDKTIRHSHEEHGFFKARKGGSQTNSVTGLVFQDGNNLISCSAGDGLIKVWDMRKTYCTNKKKLPLPKYVLRYFGQGRNGFSDLAISPSRLRLYANCIDNHIYCYDIGTYSEKPIAQYGGHVASSFYIKNSVSPDGRYIASGSNDSKAYIWSVGSKQTSPIVTLSGHSAEVTGIDWCKAGHLKMVTCSDDATFRIWQLYPQHYSRNDPQLRGWADEFVNPEVLKSEPSRKRKYYNYHAEPCRSTGDISQKENTRPLELQVKKKLCTENSVDKSSLIGDLPNFVIDGTSPHIHHCSPRPKTKVNWLNQLKPKIIEVSSKSPQGPNRKKHSSNNMSPARESILRFFKVSSRPPTCEQQSNVPSTDSQTTISSIQA